MKWLPHDVGTWGHGEIHRRLFWFARLQLAIRTWGNAFLVSLSRLPRAQPLRFTGIVPGHRSQKFQFATARREWRQRRDQRLYVAAVLEECLEFCRGRVIHAATTKRKGMSWLLRASRAPGTISSVK